MGKHSKDLPITVDYEAEAVYIGLSDEKQTRHTEEIIPNEMNFDINSDGEIIGIEILRNPVIENITYKERSVYELDGNTLIYSKRLLFNMVLDGKVAISELKKIWKDMHHPIDEEYFDKNIHQTVLEHEFVEYVNSIIDSMNEKLEKYELMDNIKHNSYWNLKIYTKLYLNIVSI